MGTSAAPRLDARSLDVRSWQLANGLQVLFLEDHKAPIATVQIFYHVGSKDEKVGIRGIAHMFEHMMFKGTEHVPPEQHARLLKEVGGVTNAFTTEDVTAFHQTVPPSYVGFALQLEAERMRRLKLLPGTVDSERRVVMEEKRLRVDNSPVGKALELLRATAFQSHPYQWTPAGAMEDLARITVADCQRFYDLYYVPSNATVIVAGDVAEADVRRLVLQHFGSVPPGAPPPRAIAPEAPQTKRREQTLTLAVELPVIIGGYPIPPANHPDVAALRVLASVLSDGESSRLNQRLVRREKLALGAGGAAQVLEQAGLFLVYAVHLPERDQKKVREVLLDEVARARGAGVTARELGRAKNQLAAQYIYGLETVDGVASQLGGAQYAEGDWRRFLADANRTLAVTIEDVARVARRYLADEHLTLVSLRPPTAATAAAPAAGAAP